MRGNEIICVFDCNKDEEYDESDYVSYIAGALGIFD